MELDYIPFIPADGLIKLRQIEPFNLGNINIQLFVNQLIELLGDGYEYWRLKGTTGVKTPGYGVLYNWFSATNEKGIAPAGYRLPTRAELLSLINDNGFGAMCDELKDTGVIFWDDPNPGTNASGFTARGTGYRDLINDGFFGIRDEFIIWSGSDDGGEEHPEEATIFYLPKASQPYVYLCPKVDGGSIRLIRETNEGWEIGETITDFDGNSYDTVKIGDQIWTSSNLITEHFNDGTRIPLVEDEASWFALETEGMCFYDNDTTNGYTEAPAQEIRIHKHDLLNFKDTDTLKWRIIEISDTEVQIVVDGLIKKTDIPDLQVQSDWDQSEIGKPDFIKNKPDIPEAQIQSDWNEVDTEAADFIKNKPTIPDGGVDQVQSDWDQSNSTAVDFIKNKPTIPEGGEDQVQADWDQSNSTAVDFIKNKPSIPEGGVDQVNSNWDAVSGVSEILNKPDIPEAQIQSDWNQGDTEAFDFIKNKPEIPEKEIDAFEVYIDFLDTTPFVYNCPYALKFIAMLHEGTTATLSIALNTNMIQYQKLTVTPGAIGLIILIGQLL